jgi:hypothetical protein
MMPELANDKVFVKRFEHKVAFARKLHRIGVSLLTFRDPIQDALSHCQRLRQICADLGGSPRRRGVWLNEGVEVVKL